MSHNKQLAAGHHDRWQKTCLILSEMARLVWSVKGDLAVVTTSKVKILSYRYWLCMHVVCTNEIPNL